MALAVSRHPDLATAQAQIDRSAAELAIAKSGYYPELNMEISPSRGHTSYARSLSNDTLTASVGIQQPLLDFGRTANEISAANASLEKSQYTRADAMNTVAGNAATTYVSLSAAQETQSAAFRLQASLRELRERLRRRVDAGIEDRSALAQTDIAIARSRADALRVTTQLQIAEVQLEKLIGFTPKEVTSTNDILSQIGRESPSAVILQDAPAIKASESAVREAEARVGRARAERWPILSLGASRDLTLAESGDARSLWLGLKLSGRFSLGGAQDQSLAAAEADRRGAAAALESRKRQAASTVEISEMEDQGASNRLDIYNQLIHLAKKTRILYWQEYTVEKRSLSDLIGVEQEIYGLEADVIATRAELSTAKINALIATGRLLKG